MKLPSHVYYNIILGCNELTFKERPWLYEKELQLKTINPSDHSWHETKANNEVIFSHIEKLKF